MDPRFDIIPQRRNTGSYKWDSGNPDPDVIPLWVADMDFRVADPIIEALRVRVDHGVFGYTQVPDAYYEAVCSWYERRYGARIADDYIIYTQGVVPAISATLKALTRPGDGVAVLTPVYNCFFSSIRNNGCVRIDVPLLEVDTIEGEFTYKIDFERLEEVLSNPRTPVLLFCNPHNPACRAWKREELLKVYELCRRTDTILLSDEIHADLTMPGYTFTPVIAIAPDASMHTVTFSSPSKAFNTAGLQIANIITASPQLRYRIDRAINDNEVCDVNPFGVAGLIAAYNHGAEWLDALIPYLHDNYKMLRDMFSKELPGIKIARLEATYLAWVKVTSGELSGDELEEILKDRYRVWINAGEMYGTGGFIRINLATSRDNLNEGLKRLVHGLRELGYSVE
ncbi:MAG: pyridoxal phosphate-dependent aminotransferase [Muribaculaceae bacterium]|nr:pyridoxal phosphate-dependent aminotransferase [Muribaculaceae bacterium]